VGIARITWSTVTAEKKGRIIRQKKRGSQGRPKEVDGQGASGKGKKALPEGDHGRSDTRAGGKTNVTDKERVRRKPGR